MYNDVIIRPIEKFNIYYKNEKINFSDLEKRLINAFINEEKATNIYVIPKENVYFILLFVIYSGLVQYLNNIYSEGNNLIDEIKQGDILEYSKARCKFIGIEDDKMKLEFSDLLYLLPIDQIYKISFYKGSGNTLNKFPRDTNRGAKKARNIISKILGIDTDAFSKIISSSTLIIAQKDVVFSTMENFKIQFEGEMLDIGAVFPSAYCLSEENYYHFRGNSSKQEPIIKFTSKIYTAKDIIKKNKKISSVVVLQDRMNIEDIEDILYMSKKNNILKTRLFMQPLDMERFMDDKFIIENFNIININKKFLQGILPQDINILNKQQYRLIKNYVNSTEKYITIRDGTQDIYRKNILKKCRNLISIFEDNNKIIKFVINARTISKRLCSMAMPIQEYEKFFESKNLRQYTIRSILNELEKITEDEFFNSLSEDSKNIIINIYDNCTELYERTIKINDKWNEIETVIRLIRNSKTAIVIENKNIRRAFRKYLKIRYPLKDNILIESLNSVKDSIFDKVIYTSRLDENYYWNYKLMNSSNNVYVLSRSDKNNIKYLKRRYLKFIRETDTLEIPGEVNETDLYSHKEQIEAEELETVEENNLNNDLDRLIATSYIPTQQNAESNQSSIICQSVLTFQSGERAFITPQYEAYVLNESREEIVNKKAKDIQKGDILLFVEDIEKDLINNIIIDLMTIEKIREKYKEDYEMVIKWKHELKNYIRTNDISYKNLEGKLKEKGISRSGATIRSWIINAVVGPQEEEVLKVLGEITLIDILLKRHDQCFKACSNIRKFQILIRKSIARCILKSWINEENSNLDLIIINRIEETMNYIKKVEVQNIYLVNKKIPMYLANKLTAE